MLLLHGHPPPTAQCTHLFIFATSLDMEMSLDLTFPHMKDKNSSRVCFYQWVAYDEGVKYKIQKQMVNVI